MRILAQSIDGSRKGQVIPVCCWSLPDPQHNPVRIALLRAIHRIPEIRPVNVNHLAGGATVRHRHDAQAWRNPRRRMT